MLSGEGRHGAAEINMQRAAQIISRLRPEECLSGPRFHSFFGLVMAFILQRHAVPS